MVAGSRTDGANQVTSFRVRKIIQSIKEIVGNHSDADIYAVLKESNMDPNETAQKLLNQDPFHEVKRKRDKKKELTGYRDFSDSRRSQGHNAQPVKLPTTWDRNGHTGAYIRNSVSGGSIDVNHAELGQRTSEDRSRKRFGVSREFRVVRDNRGKQNANTDVKPESVEHIAYGKEHGRTNLPEKSTTGTLDQNNSGVNSSEGSMPSQSVNKLSDSSPDGPGHKKEAGMAGTLGSSLLEKVPSTAGVTNSQGHREAKDNSREHSTSASSNSVIGVYSSSSDPVHVPSPVSRSAGPVGAIRREVGAVGVRKRTLNHPASDLSSSNSSSVPLSGKDVSSSSESFRQSVVTSKNNHLNEPAAPEPTVPSARSFSGSQHNSKIHHQPIGHQKVIQSTMEWKPKSSQKPANVGCSTSATDSTPTIPRADKPTNSNLVEVTNLSEKLLQVKILEERNVIIPQHLRVPESESSQLTFGSFGACFDSTKISSVSQAFESAEQSCVGPSASVSVSVPVGSSGDASADDQGDPSESQTPTRSDSPPSSSEFEQALPGNSESLNHQNIENYADIGLVQSQSPQYSSSITHHLQTPASLPGFSSYGSQTSYDVPFLRTVMEDNSRGQSFASASEAISSHATSSNPPSTVTLVQQQQQPVPHMYPQVHFSHFPNFMPYRHIFSPVYVPPMAMPNYSNNPAYPHPSNGSSYVLMPGGSSHVTTANGMKYAAAASQYKPVPAGSPAAYGNYTNPTGFTISPPGTGSVGGATVLEDSRIKYKDNNLYAPNPQGETSDIWIQTHTPREPPGLQTPPYYNLPGQPPHAAAAPFIPAAHAAHAPFNAAAAQSSHLQYPGLYHPHPPQASPASIAGPHHLAHQSGLGVAAAAPGQQVGAYQQQPQLGHINWPASF